MKQVELKDFLDFSMPSQVTLSPNGLDCAYVLTKIVDNEYVKELHLVKGDSDRLLVSDKTLGSFEFIDDETINFFACRGEKDKKRMENGEVFTSIYQIKLDGGEAYKCLELPLRVNKIKRFDEDTLLVLGGINKDYPDYYKLKGKEKEKVDQEIKDNKDYEILTESPFWFNGVGFVQSYRNSLFIYHEKNKKLERITSPSFNVSSFLIKGDYVYMVGGEFETLRNNFDGIYSYDLKNKEFKEVVGMNTSIHIMEKLNDDIIVFGSKNERYGMSENPFIYKLDGNKLVVINEADESLGHGILNDIEFGKKRHVKADGEYLYFCANDGYNTHLKRVNIKGKIELVNSDNGSVTDFDVYNGKVLFTGLFDMDLENLYLLNKGKKKLIKSFNPKYKKEHFISKPNYIKTIYKGEEIDGWVMYPINFDKNKMYPGILDIHGGPKCAYGEVYFHEMQVWASRGYFVFYCNPHGSDGKGNEFADLRMRLGKIDYENIMAFVDNVLDKYPNIDKDKLGCTGGSYGGFMSNWILGHTDRFKAIATQRSISNWISQYGVSDIPPSMDDWTNDVNPYSEKGFENQWRQSPLKYVINAKTPTLFIHSDEYYRCPISDGYQLYTALVFLGVPARMVVFHGENHELSRAGKPPHRVKRLTEITNWFEKYLQK